MYDPYNMDGPGGFGFGGPGGFGFGGPGGYSDLEAFMDPYGDMEDEPDEHEEKLMRVANCLGLFPCDDFQVTLQNACYMCNVDPEEFDEEEVEELQAMVE